MKVSNFSAAIVSTLLASTVLAAPAAAQTIEQPPQRQTLDENGVNPATGKQITYYTQLSIGPDGPAGLHMVRGRGIGADQSSMNFLITGNPSIEMYATVGLRTITFNKVAGAFQPADGSDAKLVQNSGTKYTLTLEDGTVVVYNYQAGDTAVDGRATSVTYPKGEKLTFAYRTVEYCTDPFTDPPCQETNLISRLQGIASSSGYLFHYDYARAADPTLPQQAASWKQLTNITAINTTVDPCAVSAITCTTTQTWPTIGDNPWTFTTGTNQFKVRRPGSAVDNIVINVDATTQRTTSVVRDGMTWNYAWSLSSGLLTMTRTDPLSHVLTVASNFVQGVPTSITDELGRVTTHNYDTSGRLTKTTLPEGNTVEYTYDGRGNVTQAKQVAKTGSGLPDIITSATYPASCPNIKNCNLPTTTTDARGNVTDYTWNANGEPLTVTLPAPTTGAVRPQTRYTYSNVATVGGPAASRCSLCLSARHSLPAAALRMKPNRPSPGPISFSRRG